MILQETIIEIGLVTVYTLGYGSGDVEWSAGMWKPKNWGIKA